MIVFNNIVFKNFLSYGNTETRIVLDKFGTCHISGVSGAGKSAILDAICFSLFGKPFRASNKNSLVNNINNKECFVSIEFSCSGHQYRVERGIKPTIFRIYQDSELIPEDSHNRDYQKFLEDTILGFSFVTFCQVVLVGSVNFKPFMQLSANERRCFVEDVLGIGVYSTINTLAKGELSEIKTDLSDIEIELTKNRVQLETYEEIRKKERSRNDDELTKLTERILEERKTMKVSEDGLNAKETVGRELSGILNEVDGKGIEEKIEKSRKIIQDLCLDEKRTKEQIDLLSKESCPKCGQPINREFSEREKGILTEKIELIARAKEKTTNRLNRWKSAIEMYRNAERNFEKTKYEITYLKRDIENQRLEIERLTARINEIKNPSSSKRLSVEDSVIAGLKEKILGIEAKVYELNDNLAYLEQIVRITSDNGIKTKIIQNYIPVINELVNEYLEELELPIQFSFDESFDEKILAGYQNDLKFESFSSGERARIGIALMMTWRDIAISKNSLKTNLMFLDEVFMDSLDIDSVLIFVNMLRTRSNRQDENIFVLAHRQEIKGSFDCEYNITKVSGFSVVNLDYD
jgi:hypothetical protein